MGAYGNLKKDFLEAYEAYSGAIFRHFYFRIYDREIAKELMQEAFMKAWQYVAQEKPIRNIRVLLYKIANNLIIDYIRKRKEISLDSIMEKGFNPTISEKESLDTRFATDMVKKLVNDLPLKYRQIVVMRYIDELSIKEMAQILEQTENAISVQINRALKQLRTLLKNYEYEME